VIVQSIFGDERDVAAEVNIGGTQRKDFLGIHNRGRHYELPHAFLLRLNDQRKIGLITACSETTLTTEFINVAGKLARLSWNLCCFRKLISGQLQ